MGDQLEAHSQNRICPHYISFSHIYFCSLFLASFIFLFWFLCLFAFARTRRKTPKRNGRDARAATHFKGNLDPLKLAKNTCADPDPDPRPNPAVIPPPLFRELKYPLTVSDLVCPGSKKNPDCGHVCKSKKYFRWSEDGHLHLIRHSVAWCGAYHRPSQKWLKKNGIDSVPTTTIRHKKSKEDQYKTPRNSSKRVRSRARDEWEPKATSKENKKRQQGGSRRPRVLGAISQAFEDAKSGQAKRRKTFSCSIEQAEFDYEEVENVDVEQSQQGTQVTSDREDFSDDRLQLLIKAVDSRDTCNFKQKVSVLEKHSIVVWGILVCFSGSYWRSPVSDQVQRTISSCISD